MQRDVNSVRRILAEQAFSRAGGAPLVPGNAVRLLRDAAENYPAWLEAIGAAERTIHFESYILHEDAAGRQFAERLAAKARAGVRVRLIYDWLGALGHASRRFWRSLRQAGVEVRCFNPPRFESPFGWLSRDHRKVITVDGRLAFVTGLCVGQRWLGDPARGIEPWRDTGIEIRGPAVAEVEHAFAQTWALTGEPIPGEELPDRASLPVAGDAPVRVVATIPTTASLYRLDQLIAATAQRTLWLTDAYFVGVTGYVQALRAAAMDGVDVRLLVPGATDIPVVRAVSRAGYRPLLEAGIRVFEWNGPMLHAKTAVADCHWARVGSTNLNIASWIGNWELDVAVEDDRFGQVMQEVYLEDLGHAREIVLRRRRRMDVVWRPSPMSHGSERGHGSAGRAAAGAIGIGSMIGAAITDHRVLGPAEARLTALAGLTLLLVAIVAMLWPRVVVVPFAAIGVWVAAALFMRAWRLWRDTHKQAASGQRSGADDGHT
ncbi:MAG: phospholipase D-like domain-containing protein [Candidatus Rokuibacteriota bacterium]